MRIQSWRLYLERCWTPEEKAQGTEPQGEPPRLASWARTLLIPSKIKWKNGAGPWVQRLGHMLRCDLPWRMHAGREVTVVNEAGLSLGQWTSTTKDVSAEWVSLDQKGDLYYTDRNSVNKIEAKPHGISKSWCQ